MNDHTIVALLVTRGLGDFLLNALTAMARIKIDSRIIHVARPNNAADELDPILTRAGVMIHSFSEFGQSSIAAMPDRYVDYGTEPFATINWCKVYYLRWLLERYSHVVYADVDVGWLADPLWYLQSVARYFPLAYQTEACRRFPPVLCWGFLSLKGAPRTARFIDALLKAHEERPPHAPMVDEQAASDAMITADPDWVRHIYPLPEGLFVNGLGYQSLLRDATPPAVMTGAPSPFIFHANWTMGLENKRALMRQTGTWLIDGDGAQ